MLRLLLVAVLFFCSGASALIYQVLWLRKLGLVFGVTVYAASTVWASFMFGLAVGSLLAGRAADRLRRPLVWFGVAEALIGLSALATPFALAWLQDVYAAFHPSLPRSLAAITLARFLMALLVLVVPTVLMGATLPLVVKSSYFRASDLGHRMGLLYATNTVGAIAGTLFSGLFLIPRFGILTSFVVAASVNMAVAVIAVVAGLVLPADGGRHGVDPGGRPAAGGSSPASPAQPPPEEAAFVRRTVLIVFALSGFVSLALEVIWFRVLVLLVRPTVYGFAMMLAVLLLGIGGGSYLVTPLLKRQRSWILVLAVLELLLAVVAMLSIQLLVYHPAVFRWAAPIIARVFPEYLAFSMVASFLTILPAALLLGMAFPIGLRVWTGAREDTSDRAGRRLGVFYSLNLTGSILGSLAAGFLLLPWLGSRTSLVVITAIALGSGLVLLALADARRRTRVALGAAFAALFVAGASLITDPFDLFLKLRYPRHTVLWRAEGVQATVSVNREPGGLLVMTLEGNHQAGDAPGMVDTHRRIGHLPMVIHPEARDALVIGLGGGATAGAVALHQGVEVDVVELSEAVVRGAQYFAHVNHDILSRPNVRLLVDDGRNHLLLTKKKYDVITADLILPIHAGSGNLYSVEYFTLVKNALKDEGVALQWVWGTEAEYKTIMRTFLSVFPHATVWWDGSLMIGSKKPLILRRSDFDWKLEGRAEALREVGITSFEQLLRAYVAGPDEMRAFVGAGPVLTDDLPLVEYFLSLPRDKEIDVRGLRGHVGSRVQ
ncbi:MAG TPA: fused MFS/spermidine synthase [Vicinamibacterales bacterium]|nr:fused MFS/spermidine synthase [Vicinamibacterales bacterium]